MRTYFGKYTPCVGQETNLRCASAADSGIRRVIVEREGLAGWVPWLSGLCNGLARAQDFPVRPPLRIAPSDAPPSLGL